MPDDSFKHYELRRAVRQKLAEWNGLDWNITTNSMIVELRELFGYPAESDFYQTEETLPVLQALDGPHGYAVYKAMLAKREKC